MGPQAGLFLSLSAPFVAAPLAFLIYALIPRLAGTVLALIPAAVTAYFVSLIPIVTGSGAILVGVDWLPAFSVRFSFMIDGLSLVFALLISGIGTLIILYTGAYMAGEKGAARLTAFLFLFMGSMLGLVLADDLIALFVFWEATSITSFLLIGFDHSRQAARRAALQALVITGAGGLCLLAAVLIIGVGEGHHALSQLLASGDLVKLSPAYPVILALILAAAFTKSAQFPLHSWLPNAMAAPTPVSAYLHSATMVKAGVYLLMRLQPALGGTAEWTTWLTFVGAITLIVGAFHALARSDLKLMLADTTVASLGLLVLLIGISSDAALVGAVAYLIAHALFKGGLFMAVGVIDHATGTRDINRLAGLGRRMPVTAVIVALAALSMAGLPPALGFVAKELLNAGLMSAPGVGLLVAVVLGNAALFSVALTLAIRPFWTGKPRHSAHDGPVDLMLAPLVPAIAGIAAGAFIGLAGPALVLPMASSVAGHPLSVDFHLIPKHFADPALLVSAVTIGLGALFFVSFKPLSRLIAGGVEAIGFSADRGFDLFLITLVRLSTLVTRSVQSGRLESYITVSMIVVGACLLAAMAGFGGLPDVPHFALPNVLEGGILVIALAGLAAVLFARTRLIAVVSLGVQGFAVAVLFMAFGAPDLAFTQFMVETLSVVILALVLARLSLGDRDHRPQREALRDGVIAVTLGTAFALLLISATAGPFDRRLTDFYDTYARAIAHGRNVVNVIIVDFRGLDTLGEISVVMVTGLAILALLRLRARQPILPREEKR